ncbi:MAG: prolipoprotein diacylglyceryl transferase [Acidobacteriota bacterium]|nr:prolipoprotein diacylglyceryl transferase [Acidobacteriota bacterium]
MKPILLHLAEVPVYSYGLAMILGAFLGGAMAWRMRPQGLFELSQYLNLCLLTTLGASVGARWLGATAFGGSSGAGLSSLGVPLLVVPAIFIYCRWSGLDYRRVFDYLMPFAVLGAAFQRTFGCFLAGCCGGKATGLPWGVRFPGMAATVHPTQLYLGIGLFLTFFVFVGWVSARPGRKALTVLACYAVVCLLVAPLRIGLGEPFWLELTPYAWVHGLIALLSLLAATYLSWKPPKLGVAHGTTKRL